MRIFLKAAADVYQELCDLAEWIKIVLLSRAVCL
ncbi:hypothetical protein HDA40_005548 [Hamadaea flava]|nr:hypothetical protein [Hamadaea flava]